MPPNIPELESRLIGRGTDLEEKIKERLNIAEREIEHSKLEGFHDKIIVNEDLETAYEELEAYIFGGNEKDSTLPTTADAEAATANGDTQVEMADGEGTAEEPSTTNDTPLPEEAQEADVSNATDTAAAVDASKDVEEATTQG